MRVILYKVFQKKVQALVFVGVLNIKNFKYQIYPLDGVQKLQESPVESGPN